MKIKNQIWEGVFENFSDIVPFNEVFNEKQWLSSQEKDIHKIFNLIESENNTSISSISEDSHDALSVIIGIKALKNKVTILDFGGGIGVTFIKLLHMVTTKNNIQFDILESEIICKKGKEIFLKNNQVNFINQLPSKGYQVDIINASSSMQYVDDWKALLNRFKDYKPDFMIFSDLPAGDIEPFVTTQNYYGNKIPVRFYNLSEFILVMNELGYRLTSKARQDNGYKDYMKVFEEKYRLNYFSTLVFRAT